MNLKQHIAEAKNTHMTHIEDMVIDGGVKGARAAIFALRDLYCKPIFTNGTFINFYQRSL